MSEVTGSTGSLVCSYLTLRKAIGIIGLGLPAALAVGESLATLTGLEGSVSAYYYTVMRDVFVGSLCAIAVFLLSYKGYERCDDLAGDWACVFALGVAFFPTSPDVGATPRDKWIGGLHYAFAACLFLTLAYFSLVLFRKTDLTKKPTERKLMRNKVYTVCGYTILTCIALVPVAALVFPAAWEDGLKPVFWLEAAAIVAFGVSWLTKGEAILGDLLPTGFPTPERSRGDQP